LNETVSIKSNIFYFFNNEVRMKKCFLPSAIITYNVTLCDCSGVNKCWLNLSVRSMFYSSDISPQKKKSSHNCNNAKPTSSPSRHFLTCKTFPSYQTEKYPSKSQLENISLSLAATVANVTASFVHRFAPYTLMGTSKIIITLKWVRVFFWAQVESSQTCIAI